MYQNYIFDLYGTLVDIHTNEKKAYLWKELSLFPGVPEMLQRLKDAGAFHRTGNFPARPDEIL